MAETPIAPAPIQPEPVALANLFDLFVRPSEFFAGHIALGRTPAVVFVAWVVGVGNALDRLDQRLLLDSLRPSHGGVSDTVATAPVAAFWAAVAVAGVICGLIIYRVGGLWYAQRLLYCGVRKADPKVPRHVYIYSTFVANAPSVLVSVIQTTRYGSYAAAYANAGIVDFALAVIPLFWSVIVSWKGVRAAFPSIHRRAAAIWFLILPCIFFVLFLVGWPALLALASGEQD